MLGAQVRVPDHHRRRAVPQRFLDFPQAGASLDRPRRQRAPQVIARARPDVVLLDLHMPGMDGLELLWRIRTLAPVIMVTANTDVPAARQTLKSGAFDCVTKPIDFDHLDRVIEAALAWGAPPTDDPTRGTT